ncbi:Zinc knuckle CX2CX4HX4C [Senna tora]|uniref:Zinc knuckle CX2CX4HX4C n=1 Tax=Senna tora TaxID=362788 RepID=A0A834X5W2_9FABA|nr:Zinc knuckle CX2CX4HX4C [Senna tora]
MAEKIGSLMGEVREIDWAPTLPRNLRFLRVRIRIPTHTPLLMGVILRADSGDHFWIQCKYERLFRLCRGCGRIGHLPQDCDRSREQGDLSLDAQRQWIQGQYGNAYGTMIDQAYFVPEARRFRFQPSRRTTYIRALYTRNGYQYRPRRADPVDFYFDPWVPLDANGTMDPPTQVEVQDTEEQDTTASLPDQILDTQPEFQHHQGDQVDIPLAQEILNKTDPASLDPEWKRIVERFCPYSTPLEQPLQGIRLNEERNSENRDPSTLLWIEFEPGEFGMAIGWLLLGNVLPHFEELNPIQHDPTEAEIEDTWREIYNTPPEESMPLASTFEIGESSAARANPNDHLEGGMLESMMGGTLTFRPPSRQLDLSYTGALTNIPPQAIEENHLELTRVPPAEPDNNEVLQLEMAVAWNRSSLEILEPHHQVDIASQSEDPTGQEYRLIISGEQPEVEEELLTQSTELVIMEGPLPINRWRVMLLSKKILPI